MLSSRRARSHAMNARHALVLAVAGVLFLIGCTATGDRTTRRDERRLERMMRHRDWPRIRRVAEAEVTRRETAWPAPDRAEYLPVEYEDNVWGVTAMTATPGGDVQ